MSTEPTAPTPGVPAIVVRSVLATPPLRVLLVGGGGTGARLLPPLMQILRTGDEVVVVDPDIVEDRNLTRQHFHLNDIGQPKALVLSQRYQRRGITLGSVVQRLIPPPAGAAVGTEFNTLPDSSVLVILGCVDNAGGRIAMQAYLRRWAESRGTSAWIDVGNETRGGQVILSLSGWPIRAVMGLPASHTGGNINVGLTGMDAMPQLLREETWNCPVCELSLPISAQICTKAGCTGTQAGCGERLDLQTVMVNHLSAAFALNTLSQLLLGLPFSAGGTFFSTLNTAQPIPLARYTTSDYRLHPSLIFAQPSPARSCSS